jgi:hypothetical protein
MLCAYMCGNRFHGFYLIRTCASLYVYILTRFNALIPAFKATHPRHLLGKGTVRV